MGENQQETKETDKPKKNISCKSLNNPGKGARIKNIFSSKDEETLPEIRHQIEHIQPMTDR